MKTSLTLLLFFVAFAAIADAKGRTYDRYGQKLEDDALARHPQVLALTIATRPLGGGEATEIRSVRSHHAVLAGEELRLPLTSVSGAEAGVLNVTFSLQRSPTAERRRAIAEDIEKQISARIWDGDSLFETFPFDPAIPYRTNAQKLVETTLSRHRDLLVLCLHLTPPRQQTSITFACNVGRIRRPDDEGDRAVIVGGKAEIDVMPGGRTVKIESPLHNRAGSTIGSFSVFFANQPGTNGVALKSRAEAIGVELQRQIPDLERLTAPR